MKQILFFALALLVLNASAAQPHKKPVRGEAQFRASCIGCHSISCNRAGPKLEGLLNRKAGSVADFGSYTESLRNSGIVWSDESLDALLREPGQLVPGTSMTTIRIARAQDRQDIIAYLRTQDKSIDFCF